MRHLLCLVLVSSVGAYDVQWNETRLVDILFKGERRASHLIAPRHLDKNKQYPAIVALHGNGADAAAFALETNMTQEAPRAGFYLAFPEGIPKDNSTLRCKERSWNAGSCCDDAYLNQVDDVSFLRAVVQDMLSHIRVDPKRVFIAGSSNGGSMALRAACELPEQQVSSRRQMRRDSMK